MPLKDKLIEKLNKPETKAFILHYSWIISLMMLVPEYLITHLRQINGLINRFICLKNYSWVLMLAFFPNIECENLFFLGTDPLHKIFIYTPSY